MGKSRKTKFNESGKKYGVCLMQQQVVDFYSSILNIALNFRELSKINALRLQFLHCCVYKVRKIVHTAANQGQKSHFTNLELAINMTR